MSHHRVHYFEVLSYEIPMARLAGTAIVGSPSTQRSSCGMVHTAVATCTDLPIRLAPGDTLAFNSPYPVSPCGCMGGFSRILQLGACGLPVGRLGRLSVPGSLVDLSTKGIPAQALTKGRPSLEIDPAGPTLLTIPVYWILPETDRVRRRRPYFPPKDTGTSSSVTRCPPSVL